MMTPFAFVANVTGAVMVSTACLMSLPGVWHGFAADGTHASPAVSQTSIVTVSPAYAVDVALESTYKRRRPAALIDGRALADGAVLFNADALEDGEDDGLVKALYDAAVLLNADGDGELDDVVLAAALGDASIVLLPVMLDAVALADGDARLDDVVLARSKSVV